MVRRIEVNEIDLQNLSREDVPLKYKYLTEEEKRQATKQKIFVALGKRADGSKESLISSYDADKLIPNLKEELIKRDPENAIKSLMNVLVKYRFDNNKDFLSLPNANLYVKRLKAIYKMIKNNPELEQKIKEDMYIYYIETLENALTSNRFLNYDLNKISKLVESFYFKSFHQDNEKSIRDFISAYTSVDIEETLE